MIKDGALANTPKAEGEAKLGKLFGGWFTTEP